MGTSHDQVLVGVIVGAHGIKGEVKLKSFTSDPLSIGRYGPLHAATGQVFDEEITSIKNRQSKPPNHTFFAIHNTPYINSINHVR